MFALTLDDFRSQLIQHRDELELDLATVNALLSVFAPPEPRPSRPKPQERRRPRPRRVDPVKARDTILDFVNNSEEPVGSAAAAKAAGVSQSTAGKILKGLTEGKRIEFLGEAPRGSGQKGKKHQWQRLPEGQRQPRQETEREPIRSPA